MIKLPYIGLANLVAGKKVVPEIVQYDLTPENLSTTAISLLKDKSKLQEIRSELALVKSKLGQPGASSRAAQSIINFLNNKQNPNLSS